LFVDFYLKKEGNPVSETFEAKKKEAMEEVKYGPEKHMYRMIQKAGDISTCLR